MGQEARRLIRVDIAREYTEALALAEADYTATLADAGYTASSVSARNLRETEAMLFADRAYRKALAPAKRGYSEVWQ
jgi:lipopolysaccharide biosynthesis protein